MDVSLDTSQRSVGEVCDASQILQVAAGEVREIATHMQDIAGLTRAQHRQIGAVNQAVAELGAVSQQQLEHAWRSSVASGELVTLTGSIDEQIR